MRTVADIIDALGGHRRVADALGLPPGTVSSWKSRGAIPSRQWITLLEHARRVRLKGLTAERLAALHNGRKGDAAAVAARANEGPARRGKAKVFVDRDLDEAQRAGLPVEEVAEETLRQRTRQRTTAERMARWQAEHSDVIGWFNQHIEEDGVFGEEWRRF